MDSNSNRTNSKEDQQTMATDEATMSIEHNPMNKFSSTASSFPVTSNLHCRKQLSSFILFLSVIIFVNLCPFNSDLRTEVELRGNSLMSPQSSEVFYGSDHLENCFNFMKLMFTNPANFNKRSLRFSQASAKVIGKMAKMWYIKKKIKKLSKKLKKHTIAVPVFTAIPIYEHSYYPQPHVTHVSHAGLHHAAAASSYSQAVASQQANSISASNGSGQQNTQLATSASTNHNHHLPAPYRSSAANQMGGHQQHHSVYHPMQAAGAGSHQIINSYAPSPPLFVDEAGGLYGHYGNAYGRYDGGYQLW